MIKTTLEPILEDPFDAPLPHKHKRLQQLRSDEQELIIDHDGPTAHPSSPTDTATTVQDPIKKTPDPRRKKIAQQAEQPSSSFDDTPRLPGAASPSQKSPETDKKQSHSYTTREINKNSPQMVLPPLRNVPRVTNISQHTEPQSSTPIPPGATAAGYDYYDGIQIPPVHRLPNQRLDSPRMLHKKHTPPALQMTHIDKNHVAKHSAVDDLDEFTANLNIEHDFKTPQNIKKKREELETSELKS